MSKAGDAYQLYTMQNSPYSDKIRALLAYKGIPYQEQIENFRTRFEVLQARTGKTMVPVVITPDDQAMNDSTTIAGVLEERHPTPATRWRDPSIDSLAMLLEDYADEWLVRIMLTSRWYHPADAAQNAAIIANGMTHGVWGIDFQRAAREFPPGIVSTVPRMGATPENAEGWYAMVPRILDALAAALARSPFVLGSSPHLCDFAFYGQLNQIRRDPTGYGWIEAAPEKVKTWLASLEGACREPSGASGEAVKDASDLKVLAEEAAQTYFRMSVANALAVEKGTDGPVRVKLRAGFEFDAPPAKYNRKILAANLDILEQLYNGGGRLPAAVEEVFLAELRPLANAGSSLISEREALKARL
jgi:glutathione S-transferase